MSHTDWIKADKKALGYRKEEFLPNNYSSLEEPSF